MKKSDIITYKFINWLGTQYKQDLFLPNTYLDQFEMDVMRLNRQGYVTEYEIKISRSDFKNDAKKGRIVYGRSTNKYEKYENKKSKSNRFFYVVPKDLIGVDEVPTFAGLIYYDERFGSFQIVKNAPMMHKNKYFKTANDFLNLAIKCSLREFGWKHKYFNLKKKLK